MLAFHDPAPDKATIVQALASLTERLAAPDLTAAEAQALRPRLFSLLAGLDRGTNCGANEFVGDLTVARVSGRCAVA